MSAILVPLLLFGLLLYRVRYGVDFTDESYYAALNHRFAMGDIPFVNETSIHQTAALLSFPLVKLYYALTGGLDGVVLFLRSLFLVLQGITAATVFGVIHRWIPRPVAILVASLPLAYLPFGLPTLSYNTIGMLSLTSALFLGAYLLEEKEPHRLAALLTGLCFAIAIGAYPTLLLVFLVWAGGAMAVRDPKSRPFLPGMAFGLGLGALYFGYFLSQSSITDLKRVMEFSAVGRDFTWAGKFYFVGENFFYHLFRPGLAKVLLPALGLLLIFRRAAFVPALLVVWIVWYFIDRESQIAMALFGISGILVALSGYQKDPRVKRDILLIYVPSAVAGFVTAMTSLNGFFNAGVGLFPAVIITVVWMVRRPKLPLWRGVLIALLPLFFFTRSAMREVYQEGRISGLVAKTSSGPFAGLWTTPAKAAFLEKMQTELIPRQLRGGGLLSYDYFPAAYLMVPMRPMLCTVWTWGMDSLIEHRQRVVGCARKDLDYGLILRLNTLSYPANDPIDQWVKSCKTCRLEKATPEFSIYSFSSGL